MNIVRICTTFVAVTLASFVVVDIADGAPRYGHTNRNPFKLDTLPNHSAFRGGGIDQCDSANMLVSENLDMGTITPGNSVSCFGGSGTPEHSYGRSHDLSQGDTAGLALQINCIHFALAQNSLAGFATVHVYLDLDFIPGPTPDGSDLWPLGSVEVQIPDTESPVVISASPDTPYLLNPDSVIFIEIVIPESYPGTHEIGSNSAGELSPTWLRTTNGECGIGPWVNPSALGFPNMHLLEAVEVAVATLPDPCADALPACVEDVDGDGIVAVSDILAIIGNWGNCGDGSFRPEGDIAPLPNGDCCVTVADILSVISAWGIECEPPVGDSIMINEVRLNEPGTDDNEYFELIGMPGELLDGLTYVVIGDGSGTDVGVIEDVIPLDGQFLNAIGLFLCGKPTMTIGNPDLPFELNFESNDQTTHLLVSGFTGSLDEDLDIDDDGVLDALPWDTVLDCVAYIGPEPELGDPVYCDTQVGPDDIYTPGQVYRCPDASGDWFVGTFELSVLDTPGAPNNCDMTDSDGDGVFDFLDNCPNHANADQADCDGDGYGDVCAIADGISQDCNSNGIPDECEADCNTNGIPDACDIADGTSQDSNGNGIPDECEVPIFVINEIHADPSNNPDGTYADGDANGDGVGHYGDDEFVELVNMSGVDIDMSDWTLSDSFAVRHTFPLGTILSDGCAIVVFGGGTPTGTFGGAIVMVSSEGYLGLNNDGDTITIADASGEVELFFDYNPIGAGNNQSITLSPDVYGENYYEHSTVAPDGALFSPGTDIYGNGFGGDCGGGSLPDTDGDGVPDKYDNCDLPNPDQADCNGNGIGDVCDLADGTSVDDNGNGIPDECEGTAEGGWINEFHYDNAGSDVNEFVEIVLLDGVEPDTVTLSLYNGSNGQVLAFYNVASHMTVGETVEGSYTIYSILHAGIQNSVEGISLDVSGAIIEFISYEGSFTAVEGPAQGVTSVDIGLQEGSGTTVDSSLGRTGRGGTAGAFTWVELVDLASMGTSNDGQLIEP